MPYSWDAAGFPNYIPSDRGDDDDFLRPVVPSPRLSPIPSPRGSPNPTPMYLDEHYNYVQPATGYIGVPMMPTGFVPLPPSPSMLSASFVPLPPSPYGSPRHGPIPLSPHSPGGMLGAYPQYQQPTHPFDPYYFPQAGNRYMNLHYTPRTSVHPLLKDAEYIHLDLASHSFKPMTPNDNWVSRRYNPIHEGYLSQVATYPYATELKITCKALGRFAGTWVIKVKTGRTVSVGDVLKAVYEGLHTRMTHAEWAKLTENEAYEAARQYTRRCREAEFERVQGVRRVDLLGKKHWFGGLKKVRDDDSYNFELLVKAE